MATEKKERQFVRADGTPAPQAERKPAPQAEKKSVPQAERKPAAQTAEKKPTAKSEFRPAKITAEAKKKAKGLRWGAVLLWLAGLAFEVLTILYINGTFYIPGNNKLAYIIIGVVLDLACVIAGSQLWKKANRIDPASEKQKVKFFLWNQMGVIAALIDFVPLVVLLLKDKDLDEKTKKIASIVAVVAALAAVGTSIDYHPVSAEDLAAAQQSVEEYTYDGTVHWTQFGKCYHFDDNCQSIRNSATVYYGTIEEAFEAKRSRACSFCADAEALVPVDKLVSSSDFFDEMTEPELDSTEDFGDDLLAPAA